MQTLPIMILGLTGSGKSTSIKNLDPGETFLINCGNKPLPFKGGGSRYSEINGETNPKGNKLTTDSYKRIRGALSIISTEREDIKNIIIDDSQQLIINEFMRKHSIQGKGDSIYQLYNEIADHFWALIEQAKDLRDDLIVFFLHHAEITESGRITPKTVGKLLNDKIEIPSQFTVVLYSVRELTNNFFFTQNDGTHPAKSPAGMFEELKIANDLQVVRDSALLYYTGE